MAVLKRPLKARRDEASEMVYAYSIVRLSPQDGSEFGHEIIYCSDKPLPIGQLLVFQETKFRVKREEVRFKK